MHGEDVGVDLVDVVIAGPGTPRTAGTTSALILLGAVPCWASSSTVRCECLQPRCRHSRGWYSSRGSVLLPAGVAAGRGWADCVDPAGSEMQPCGGYRACRQ